MTAIGLAGPGLAPGPFFARRARGLMPCALDDRRMSSGYLWVKAFHIVFVASWFAGLFYLPRLFVNLAMVAPDSHAERERLLLMARKLYRFASLLMVPASLLGLVLWLGYGVGLGAGNGWMHVKLVLVLAAPSATTMCAAAAARFEQSHNQRSDRWFRVFNEVLGAAVRGHRGAGGRQAVLSAVRPALAPLCANRSSARRRWRWPMRRWWSTPACIRSPAGAGRRGRRWRALCGCPGHRGATRSTWGPTCWATCRWAPCSVVARRARVARPWRAHAVLPCCVFGVAVLRDGGAAAVPAAARAVARGLGLEQRRRAAGRGRWRAAACAWAWCDRWQALRERWFVRDSAGRAGAAGAVAGRPAVPDAGAVGAGPGRRAAARAWLRPCWSACRGPIGLLAQLRGAGTGRRHCAPLSEALVVALRPAGAVPASPSACRSRGWRRALLAFGAAAAGRRRPRRLSTALNFGPAHALGLAQPIGAAGAGCWHCCWRCRPALAGHACRVRAGAGGADRAGGAGGQAPVDPYFAQSLQAWEQGRFIRFHGLAQWIGWLWPYARDGLAAAADSAPRLTPGERAMGGAAYNLVA